ncbi:GntR family transcriptional regulator [Rummeliibacillus suwonensis]|uniref:GntR family transcriptional regulator n=1 Tax=Rummeliibacillus suwonensis TaxID=1306154 RepID=UPI0011B81AE0|nr:GntR family transcriptional regulator [Rummeliibacillus suwonensis]MBO2536833.1 GntR family transcriptional regulator [Rummeliibacillus suwonensis]
MFIQIQPHSDTPIYIQLTQQIIEGIVNKDIEPGESLPSVRTLAADLGVNMHTVNKSYHELEKKGLITIIPKSGAIVNVPRKMGNANAEQLDYMEKMLRPVVAEGIVQGLGMNDFEKLIKRLMKTLY